MIRRATCLGLGLCLLAVPAFGAQERKEPGAESKAPAPPDRYAWKAWATRGRGAELTVAGIFNNGSPGAVAVLRPAQPQGTNPRILILELTLAQLPGDWPLIVTPIPAWYVQDNYKGQYDSVTVRFPDGGGVDLKIIDAGLIGPTPAREPAK
jgi:hypothetical protein